MPNIGRFNSRLFGLFVVFLLPIFVSLNFSSGLRFDADPFNYLGAPSLPLSLLFFGFVFFKNIIRLRFSLTTASCFFVLALFLVVNFFWVSSARPLILFFGMLVPLLNYYSVKALIKKNNVGNAYLDGFFYSLCFILFIKFIADVVFFETFFSKYFIREYFVIYNSHDYFPFVYVLSQVLSLWMLLQKRNILLAVSFFVFSVLCLWMGHSRFFLVMGFLCLPVFFLVRLFKLPTLFLFYFMICIVVLCTLFIGFVGVGEIDPSFDERFSHWVGFFEQYRAINIIFPFINEYRQSLNYGTFHNELLEIYSYYGLASFVYILLLGTMFSAVDKRYRSIAQVLLVILVLGMLIQMNFTNPYLGIIWSTLLAIMARAPLGSPSANDRNVL